MEGLAWPASQQAHSNADQLVEAILERLPQLRQLTVDFWAWVPAKLPPALAALSQLQRFCWLTQPPAALALPRGAWLSNVEYLALPAAVAAASGAALFSAAPGLRWLALSAMDAEDETHQELVMAAGQHPTLRHLRLQGEAGFRVPLDAPLPGYEGALAQARRQKPALTHKSVSIHWLSRSAEFIFEGMGGLAEWEEDS